jgi:histidyl-tRNA synthetase
LDTHVLKGAKTDNGEKVTMCPEKDLEIGGFRDFYPELYRKIDIILTAFRQIPKLYGYVEYECPTVEPLKLYELKSGEGLIAETFRVTDRKKRRLVLRPEITPSLARMLAAKQQFYPRPIRWFSVSRVFRDETLQRGRVKEFWQLNVDILGIEDVAADAEVIDILIQIIKSLGFTSGDFVIRINDRRLIQNFIESLGLKNYIDIIRVLDRREKLLQEALETRLTKLKFPPKRTTEIALILRKIAGGNKAAIKELPSENAVQELVSDLDSIMIEAATRALQKIDVPDSAIKKLLKFVAIYGEPTEFLSAMKKLTLSKETQRAIEPLEQLASQLKDIGITEYCEFNAGIARGLDYYTGIVFEAWDRAGELPRAIAGGGRYDDLVSVLEGQPLPGTGFGMGETVILELAERKNLLPSLEAPASLYLAPVSKKQLPFCRQLATQLRQAGIKILFNGFSWSLSKHLEDAGKRQIPLTAIIGPKELSKDSVNIRDMETGKEQLVKIDQLVEFVLSHSTD